jgi:hypothetical protein
MADKDVRIDEASTRIFRRLTKNNDNEGISKLLGLDWENLTCWFCGRRGHIMKQCTVPKDSVHFLSMEPLLKAAKAPALATA